MNYLLCKAITFDGNFFLYEPRWLDITRFTLFIFKAQYFFLHKSVIEHISKVTPNRPDSYS